MYLVENVWPQGVIVPEELRLCYRCPSCLRVIYRKDFPVNAEEGSSCRLCIRLSRYRLNYIDYEAMLMAQEDKCAICGTPAVHTKDGFLVVDHAHALGLNRFSVRGLLCRECNLALGLFHDRTNLLRRAIRYLDDQNIRERAKAWNFARETIEESKRFNHRG